VIYTNRLARRSARAARLDAGYDVPQFSIHRGKLQGVIYRPVRGGSVRASSHRPPAWLVPTERRRRPPPIFSIATARIPPHAQGDVLIGCRRHPLPFTFCVVSERRSGAWNGFDALARREWIGRSFSPAFDGDRGCMAESLWSIIGDGARADLR